MCNQFKTLSFQVNKDLALTLKIKAAERDMSLSEYIRTQLYNLIYNKGE